MYIMPPVSDASNSPIPSSMARRFTKFFTMSFNLPSTFFLLKPSSSDSKKSLSLRVLTSDDVSSISLAVGKFSVMGSVSPKCFCEDGLFLVKIAFGKVPLGSCHQ